MPKTVRKGIMKKEKRNCSGALEWGSEAHSIRGVPHPDYQAEGGNGRSRLFPNLETSKNGAEEGRGNPQGHGEPFTPVEGGAGITRGGPLILPA